LRLGETRRSGAYRDPIEINGSCTLDAVTGCPVSLLRRLKAPVISATSSSRA
jgi:hypothetical protein